MRKSFIIIVPSLLIVMFFLMLFFLKDSSLEKSYLSNVIYKNVMRKLSCFPIGTRSLNGGTLSCEPSAVLLNGDKVIFANDQRAYPTKKFSPIFFFDFKDFLENKLNPKYLREDLFLTSKKYEAMSLSPDGKWSFAMTGFTIFTEENRFLMALIEYSIGQAMIPKKLKYLLRLKIQLLNFLKNFVKRSLDYLVILLILNLKVLQFFLKME